MKKQKKYSDVKFSPTVIKEAYQLFYELVKPNHGRETRTFEIRAKTEVWHFDSEEEFYTNYRGNIYSAVYSRTYPNSQFELAFTRNATEVTIQINDRDQIQAIFEIFESKVSQAKIIPDPDEIKGPIIFIGHGHSDLWRDLKDHLQDKHNFKVEAYEVGSRAGHTIRDILESMLKQSSFALLVMTGDDETREGQLRARQNVIHEIGLFQGRLGFSRAIILQEEGTEDFSNNSGIQYLRFSKGNIKEVFGDVLAVIRREFPSNPAKH